MKSEVKQKEQKFQIISEYNPTINQKSEKFKFSEPKN